MNLSQEHTFINLKSGDKILKYARQNYVNRRFSNKLFSIYSDYNVVGFTLNKTKTKVIRIFYNKYSRPEGDLVVETVHYPVKVGLNSFYYKMANS
jgi:hypothetical protein